VGSSSWGTKGESCHPASRQVSGGAGLMKTWGCTGLRFIRFPLFGAGLLTPPECRSHPLIINPGFKGTCALRAHSEGGRPSVGHSCGVRRPAHNKRFLKAQQKLRVAKGSREPIKANFSSAQGGAQACPPPKRRNSRRCVTIPLYSRSRPVRKLIRPIRSSCATGGNPVVRAAGERSDPYRTRVRNRFWPWRSVMRTATPQ